MGCLQELCRCSSKVICKLCTYSKEKFQASGSGIFKYIVAINIGIMVVLLVLTFSESAKLVLKNGMGSSPFQSQSRELTRNSATNTSIINDDSVFTNKSNDSGPESSIEGDPPGKVTVENEWTRASEEDSGSDSDDRDEYPDYDDISEESKSRDDPDEQNERDIDSQSDTTTPEFDITTENPDETKDSKSDGESPFLFGEPKKGDSEDSEEEEEEEKEQETGKDENQDFNLDSDSTPHSDMFAEKAAEMKNGGGLIGNGDFHFNGPNREISPDVQSLYRERQIQEIENKLRLYMNEQNTYMDSPRAGKTSDAGSFYKAQTRDSLGATSFEQSDQNGGTSNYGKMTGNVKVILSWTPMYNKAIKWEMDASRFNNCAFKNCLLTSDKRLAPRSDAILFHMWDMAQQSPPVEPPKFRRPNQLWVLTGKESPAYTDVTSSYNGVFNATYTYRRDSDIVYPHGYIVPLNNPPIAGNQRNFAAGKTRIAVWVASHCKSESKRELYVEELMRHLPVDIFGKCGNMSCGHRHAASPEEADMCNRAWAGTYKFSLAFENSICTDYVTEKVWKPLYYGSVPIVMGGADYEAILPPHSYIDIRQFSSPETLANYLKMLDKNDDKYNEYFAWRRSYAVSMKPIHYCNLCEYVNNPRTYKVYDDIDTWWNKCK